MNEELHQRLTTHVSTLAGHAPEAPPPELLESLASTRARRRTEAARTAGAFAPLIVALAILGAVPLIRGVDRGEHQPPPEPAIAADPSTGEWADTPPDEAGALLAELVGGHDLSARPTALPAGWASPPISTDELLRLLATDPEAAIRRF